MSGQANAAPAIEPENNVTQFPASEISKILNRERRNLLDLTARNRLLNVPRKKARSKTLEIIDEKTEEVFRILVQEGRSMDFLPIPDAVADTALEDGAEEDLFEGLPQPTDPELDASGNPKRHVDRYLQTPHHSEKLQKRLLGLYYDARTYEEEQGVNILFLAMGFLKWFEDDTSDKPRWAPLMLIPVSLTRDSVGDRFKLEFREDDISTNLSLREKLQHDFSIGLPELPELDDLSPAAYCEEVRRAISNKKRWEVVLDDIVLGFFSFSKFLMYRDLDPQNWPENTLEKHEIITSLITSDGFRQEQSVFQENDRLDQHLHPENIFHVVDCDSSQSFAIEEVRHGRNLIIQGPPGTGKSQTITNLIASAVQDGKTVLFVAEKMAALDVVKRRLENIGLGDMCLELHSYKANKKQVLSDLEQTLTLGQPQKGNTNKQASELKRLRDELNAFVEVLHKPLSPSALTPYQLLGTLVKTNAQGLKDIGIKFSQVLQWTRDDIEERIDALNAFSQAIELVGTPAKSPWEGVEIEIALPDDIAKLKEQSEGLVKAISSLIDGETSLANQLNLPFQDNLADCRRLSVTAALMAASPDFAYQLLKAECWTTDQKQVWALIETGLEFAARQAQVEVKFSEIAWETNVNEARIILAASVGSMFRFFKPAYWKARGFLKGLMKPPLPKNDKECIELFDLLISGQKAKKSIQDQVALGQKAFGEFWRNEKSSWTLFKEVFDWNKVAEEYYSNSSYLDIASDRASLKAILALSQQIKLACDDLQRDIERIFVFIKVNPEIAFKSTQLDNIPLNVLVQKVSAWQSTPEGVTKWIGFRNSWKTINKLDLENLPQIGYDGALPPEALGQQFNHILYTQLFRDFAAKRPEFAAFDGQAYGLKLDKFRKLDVERIELARQIVATTHWESIPKGSQPIGGVGIIRGEIQKKRKHLPLRKLIKQAGQAAQKIKPVFMMSPMSVAQYLEPGAVTFDLLLVDEASQVQPVDALGSIARARQIVVVGDSKQLPPTSFFSAGGDNGDDDDSVQQAAGDMESILGLCEQKGMPNKMLRWHYRSKHHSLIAFSNDAFYDNKLFIVPSPYPANDNLGLHFVKVNGIYDRGKTATNRIEAQAVAQACIEHARRFPNLTLGVGAFSMRQQQAIQDELEHLYRDNPDVHEFFGDSGPEPFFVKNLENIQGDERDVILLSIGYARNEEGYIGMTFGPLTSDGGQRRLNVLVTRARQKCIVFSSITADDIDLSRTQSLGAAALKRFLTFAQTGQLSTIKITGKDFDSDFEEEVAKAITQFGYEVEPQLGVAGFFVDLAIKDPANPGAYLLGVECDGAAYHSSSSARDRDRLRQQVLEAQGWVIHRLWSTDWFYRPDAEIRKVLAALEAAKQKKQDKAQAYKAAEVTQIVRAEAQLGLEQVTTIQYQEAKFRVDTSFEPHMVAPGSMTDIVTKIIEIEGPIHKEEITRRVTTLWGLQRAGSRISASVVDAIRRSQKREPKVVIVDGDFCRYVDKPIVLRDRSNVEAASLKKPETIAPAEIQQGVYDAIDEYAGVTEEDAIQYVSRKLGFQRAGPIFQEAILKNIKKMEKNRLIHRPTDRYERLSDGILSSEKH